MNAPTAELKPQQISYSVQQAAVAVGISEASIRSLVRKGHLAARYYGSKVLVDAESLARWYNALPSEVQVYREVAANRGAA